MDWIVANREWLLSGILVAVPIAVIGWLFARRQSHRSQRQKGGDKSTNIQAGTITVHAGVSVTEVRQMALDVFRANFFELAGEARDIARSRAEEITEDFLKKLQEQHAEGLQQAQEPDFQHALFTVQKEHARCGDQALGDLLNNSPQ